MMLLQAFAAPYDSLVVDKDGRYRYSPSLYEPAFQLEDDLKGITDVFVDSEDRLYAAVTSNGRGEVFIYTKNGERLKSIGGEILKSASGVFVSDKGDLYVVDYTESKIYVFDSTGILNKTIEKPTSPLYGKKTPFKPFKLVVDHLGTLYVISEGTTNGIVQLNSDGEFQGFFGPNLTESTLIHELQKRFFTEEMLQFFIKSVPSSMNNIDIDDQGIIYATTKGDTKEPLKKINIAGRNLLPDLIENEFFGDGIYLDFRSVAVDKHGNMMALSGAYGQVFVFDQDGNNIGIFGAKKEGGNNVLGITTNPIDIAVDSSQRVYIADAAGSIQVFEPTPLMMTIYDALALYNDGKYLESESLWREVIMRNTSVAIASKGLGHSAFKRQSFSEAMTFFKNANDKASYSNAFWEVRQEFILNNIIYIFLGLLALVLAIKICKLIVISRVSNRPSGVIRSQYKSVVHVLKHPRDAYYDLRFNNTISLGTAIFLITLTLVLRVVHVYGTGFLFNDVNLGYFQPLQKIGNDALLMFLFLVSNYLVSSIRDGEGSFIQVFKGMAVAFVPLILLEVPGMLLSNVLTLQEVFIYQLLQWVMYAWCLLLIFCMIMEIHDYTPRETIVNLLLTVFVMIVLFVVSVVIMMLAKEFVMFIKSLIEEALNRV
jgi:hypothetical protein